MTEETLALFIPSTGAVPDDSRWDPFKTCWPAIISASC